MAQSTRSVDAGLVLIRKSYEMRHGPAACSKVLGCCHQFTSKTRVLRLDRALQNTVLLTLEEFALRSQPFNSPYHENWRYYSLDATESVSRTATRRTNGCGASAYEASVTKEVRPVTKPGREFVANGAMSEVGTAKGDEF